MSSCFTVYYELHVQTMFDSFLLINVICIYLCSLVSNMISISIEACVVWQSYTRPTQEKFEDTTGIIWNHKSKKYRQNNGQKKKYKETNKWYTKLQTMFDSFLLINVICIYLCSLVSNMISISIDACVVWQSHDGCH
jgi:hypothetical protein